MPDLNRAPQSVSRPKRDATRAQILSAALDLFREQGFDNTTMREIAKRAGVATGATYYYFDSKDAIVLSFYNQAQKDMVPQLENAIAVAKDLKDSLHRLLRVKIEYFAASRTLLGALAAHADPEHALSPFSTQTRSIRERDIEFFEKALIASRVRVAADLKLHLPRLLWLYQMGVILFWIYDRSANQRRTDALIEKSLTVVVRLVKLSGLPLMQPLRRIVRDLMDAVTEDGDPPIPANDVQG
jgi:AcrR family transcriptional regulator